MKEYIVRVFENRTIWYDKNNENIHREGGPAIEYHNGRTEWVYDGKLHRENGPAVECADGSKYWYQNNLLHREDGPAIIFSDGTLNWCLNDVFLSKEEFNERIKPKEIPCTNKIIEIDGKKYKLIEVKE